MHDTAKGRIVYAKSKNVQRGKVWVLLYRTLLIAFPDKRVVANAEPGQRSIKKKKGRKKKRKV